MLSILIPTYNYDVQPLVLELQKQAEELGVAFEIIIAEDDTTSAFSVENFKLNEFKNTCYSINPVNFGRAKNRNELVDKAAFDLLLFLDADTFPVNSKFIKMYVDFYLQNNSSLVFGGLKYQKEKPQPGKLLRWMYGNRREALNYELRQKKPFKTIFLSNLLIKKEIIRKFSLDSSIVTYGYEDTLFFNSLKNNNISVTHFDNPVYHLGLEEDDIYLKKVEESLVNLKAIIEQRKINGTEMNLVRAYEVLKKLKLDRIFSFIFTLLKSNIRKKITGNKPSLFFFDLYRLGYLCTLKNSQVENN